MNEREKGGGGVYGGGRRDTSRSPRPMLREEELGSDWTNASPPPLFRHTQALGSE